MTPEAAIFQDWVGYRTHKDIDKESTKQKWKKIPDLMQKCGTENANQVTGKDYSRDKVLA